MSARCVASPVCLSVCLWSLGTKELCPQFPPLKIGGPILQVLKQVVNQSYFLFCLVLNVIFAPGFLCRLRIELIEIVKNERGSIMCHYFNGNERKCLHNKNWLIQFLLAGVIHIVREKSVFFCKNQFSAHIVTFGDSGSCIGFERRFKNENLFPTQNFYW